MHPQCAKVRMADRCVRCNPGYDDPDQSDWLYEQTVKNGLSREEAELAYVCRLSAESR